MWLMNTWHEQNSFLKLDAHRVPTWLKHNNNDVVLGILAEFQKCVRCADIFSFSSSISRENVLNGHHSLLGVSNNV